MGFQGGGSDGAVKDYDTETASANIIDADEMLWRTRWVVDGR
jgi:hypothetical protein